MRPDFDRAQRLATELLLEQNLASLFIDIRKFNFHHKIIIDSMQHYCQITKRPLNKFICEEFRESYTLKLPNKIHIILYNDYEKNEERKHWGIVHEVGHIYLGHTQDGDNEEIEAHFFAAQIVAPEIALYEIAARKGSLDIDDLTYHFNISKSAAQKRLETMRKKYIYHFQWWDKELLERLRPTIHKEFPPGPQEKFPPLSPEAYRFFLEDHDTFPFVDEEDRDTFLAAEEDWLYHF